MGSSHFRSAIEAYPHLLHKLVALWGSAEFERFAHHLLTDTRDGARQGFPPEVAAELLLAAQVNRISRALRLAESAKLPFTEAYRRIEQEDTDKGAARGPSGDPRSRSDASRQARAGYAPFSAATKSSPKRSSPEPAEGLLAKLLSLLFSKTFWLFVVALLTLKLVWPHLHLF
ncbi:MAG: hypothetical protein N2441_02860 [Rhodocyclaceae bacterium]|nr:hypothetical protein [Rhodocyclaceae bacterium]